MVSKLALQFYRIIGLSLIVSSCNKDSDLRLNEAESYVGLYNCQVEEHYADMWTGFQDTIYFASVWVSRSVYDIVVLGKEANVDLLSGGKKFESSTGSGYFSLQFVADSLFFYGYSGGGGGYSKVWYSGKKS